MSLALVGAGLLMGLAGSPHCAVMCAAPCAAVARRCGGEQPARALWALHLGRTLAYSAAGALSAASVGLLARWSGASAVLRPVWTMLEVAVLLMGLALLWSGRMPRWVDGAAQSVSQGARIHGPKPASKSAGLRLATLLGLAWVGLPCGLLWGALAVSALASGPMLGAAVMASFALGSALGLVGAPWLWTRLARQPQTLALRLAGLMLVGAGAFALLHGFDAAFAAWCATV
jgi:sulfite exporter TauE/SafE